MAKRKYTLIGSPLSMAEVEKFPSGQKFSRSDLREDVPESEHRLLMDTLSSFGYLVAQSDFKCPVGPHDDPALAVRVTRACGMGRSRTVAVQCSQGHWAEYPCT